jgi:hypothetical protein
MYDKTQRIRRGKARWMIGLANAECIQGSRLEYAVRDSLDPEFEQAHWIRIEQFRRCSPCTQVTRDRHPIWNQPVEAIAPWGSKLRAEAETATGRAAETKERLL